MAAIVPCEHGWAPGICVTCLQRQLQQAEEEARVMQLIGVRARRNEKQAQAERDEAIERAESLRRAVWWAIWAVEQGTFLRTADWWEYFYAAGALAAPAEAPTQRGEGDA